MDPILAFLISSLFSFHFPFLFVLLGHPETAHTTPKCLFLPFLARHSSLSLPFLIPASPFPSFPVALQFTCREMFRNAIALL